MITKAQQKKESILKAKIRATRKELILSISVDEMNLFHIWIEQTLKLRQMERRHNDN